MSQAGGHQRRGTPGPGLRSIRPFRSSEQYLEAMTEDLAEWLRGLYGLDLHAANFLQELETGQVLCRHANAVTEAALAHLAEAPGRAAKVPVPRTGVACNGAARPGTFQARDNVSNFIRWCRQEMGIQEVLMFETEDLVQRKNVKNVVLCLLELGRRAWHFGLAAPTLVQLERDIERELLDQPAPRRPCHFRNLDQMVQSLVSRCTCPVQFSMIKESEGRYRVGDSNTLLFIRILRSHVMVRVGGGWDTLGHYLDKHDPCRCTSLSHKTGSFQKPPAPPAQHQVRVQDGPSQPQPTMTVSRSQSPPPPVDWKMYTSLGPRLRPPACTSPRPRREPGAGGLQEATPPLRCPKTSCVPSGRQLPAEDSLSSLPSSLTPGDQDPGVASAGKERRPPEVPERRTPTLWGPEGTLGYGTRERPPAPYGRQAPDVSAQRTPARGLCPPPSSCGGPLGPALRGEAEGAPSQLRRPAPARPPSPGQGPTGIPTRPDPPRHPTPTPGRGSSGWASRGPEAQLGHGHLPLRGTTGLLAGSRDRSPTSEARPGEQRRGVQVTAQSQARNPQEPTRRPSPLPPARNEEQAADHRLDERPPADAKLLEAGVVGPQGGASGVVPRSGVYVPSIGGRWPEPGGPYDRVIRELTQAPPPLLKVDPRAWRAAPAGPGSPTSQGLDVRESCPRTKGKPAATGIGQGRRKASPEEGQHRLAPPVVVAPEIPAASPSGPGPDRSKASPSKGKRTLRKPQRIPSIYKLKLRPRIRPRRDHRPEKRPSRIPRPLACLHLGAAARGPCRPGRVGTAVSSKHREGALDGEKEKEGQERKELVAKPESSPQPPEGPGPRELDLVSLAPEEESWV